MSPKKSTAAGSQPKGKASPPQVQQQVPGVILRAHDGTLHFIPDRALATFKVTSSMGKAAVQGKFNAVHSGQEPAPRAEALHVSIPNTVFGKTEVFR